MKQFLKEIEKGVVGFCTFNIVLLLLSGADYLLGHWLTDHRVTKVLGNVMIVGAMVVVMALVRAKTKTIILTNIVILVLIDAVSTAALSYLFPTVVLLAIWFVCEIREKK